MVLSSRSTAPTQIASVKIAGRKAENPELFQALQDIVNRVNGYILERRAADDAELAARVESGIILANGANQSVAFKTGLVKITGPTAGFSVGGIVAGTSGQTLTIVNLTVQVMTINYLDAGSVGPNQILTSTAGNVAAGGAASATSWAQLIYNNGNWLLLSTS